VVPIKPLPEVAPSPFPWTVSDDGTVTAADGKCVCVLGDPFETFTEQDLANAALIIGQSRQATYAALRRSYREDHPNRPKGG
jgi:hypothetical protein